MFLIPRTPGHRHTGPVTMPLSSGPNPRFSIVIPARNEEAFLGACLDSLLAQDYREPCQIIVVDNNSTDGTASVAAARGVTVVHESQPGVCWARQRGTQLADGEIVVSTDADTVFSPGWLSRIDQEFRRDPAPVAVAGPCRFTEAPWWGRAYAWVLFHLVQLLTRLTGRVPYVTATNLAFRKRVFCGYDTQATQGGDELGLLRQLRAHGPVVFIPGNPVFTSARRMYRGLAYNLLVTCLFYYLLGYSLNRIAGRTIVGMAPSIRTSDPSSPVRRRLQGLVGAGVGLVLLAAAGDLTIHLARRWG